MTSPTERDLASALAGIESALVVDVPWLVETAEVMRRVDLVLDARADRLADMARRWRRTIDVIAGLRERGLLDDTLVMAIADLELAGPDHADDSTPIPTGRDGGA